MLPLDVMFTRENDKTPCSLQDVVLIAIGIGAIFSLIFHLGVDEVKEQQAYHSANNKSQSPTAMKASDWLKEKQFYQVTISLNCLQFLMASRC